MKKIYFSIVGLMCLLTAFSQTNPTQQTIPYSQDFSGLVATSIVYPAGWQGWTISTTPGGTFNTSAPTADRALIASSDASTTSGNVHNYNGKIGYLNTSPLDLTIVLALDATAKSNVQITYDIMTIRNPYNGGTNTRINEVTLQYRIGTTGSFTNLTGIEYQNNTTTQTGVGVTTPQNLQNKIITLPAGCNNQPVIQIRWASRQVSGAGSRPSFAVDNIVVNENTSLPAIIALSPPNGSTNLSPEFFATVTFNTNMQKGTGNIYVKRISDNVIIQTIDVTTASVTVTNNQVSFTVTGLAYSTSYYIEMDAGTFKDLSNNNFNGISGNSTWTFTTMPTPPPGVIGTVYNFNTCTSPLGDGFSQYSVVGPQLWACTTFGRDAANPPLGSAPNGLQINGFSGTNIPNEDWLVSPAFDLTATTFPLLTFWSRTKFNGLPLSLKVSTNYPGFGNPNNYIWTDLNGKFPEQTSDSWTESSNINLSAFKTTNVYFAFVYYSSNDDGARWTLDDILLINSPTPPPPSLTVSATDIQFGYVAAGGNIDKTFTVTGNDITGDITLTSTTGFTLADNAGGPFSSSLTLTQATSNNITRTVYARYSPSQNNLNYTGTVTISSPSVTNVIVNLRGTSIDPINTLEVVNWNMEWFGSTSFGPSNKALQQANAQLIMQNIGADIYGLVEVVDESRLATIVSNMPGYAYVICNYGSHTNPFEAGAGPLSAAQKEAYVYKISMFTNISTTALVTNGVNTAADLTNPAYNYFASGRYPFMMTADVTLNSVTKTIRFVLLHGKANTSPTATSYARRKAGSDTLKYTLNNLYPFDNIVFLGDINDDLDSTITDGINPKITSYVAFRNDTVTTFSAPTLALSLAGKKSTVSYNDMIDHVILSNEMANYYMSSSANVLTDVTSLVANYGTTTSDHYPIFTRYAFDPVILPVPLLSFNAFKLGSIAKITWSTSQEINAKEFIIERLINGNNWQVIATVPAIGNSNNTTNYSITDASPAKGINLYRLKSVDIDNKFVYSAIRRVDFENKYTYSIYPNPASDIIQITTDNSSGFNATMQVANSLGQVIISKQMNGNSQPALINISSLSSGIYILKIITADGTVSVIKFSKQ